ncbi:MAG: NUDIX domain-containing protein, partial [Methanobacteriota archaeon]
FWAKKDAHAWSFPKGEYSGEETPLEAAKREFREETGWEPQGKFYPLGEVKQKSGKQVIAWAFEGEFDPTTLTSNTFELEWPPRSGKKQKFPEVDRAEWFPLDIAREKIHKGLVPFLDALERLVATL